MDPKLFSTERSVLIKFTLLESSLISMSGLFIDVYCFTTPPPVAPTLMICCECAYDDGVRAKLPLGYRIRHDWAARDMSVLYCHWYRHWVDLSLFDSTMLAHMRFATRVRARVCVYVYTCPWSEPMFGLSNCCTVYTHTKNGCEST